MTRLTNLLMTAFFVASGLWHVNGNPIEWHSLFTGHVDSASDRLLERADEHSIRDNLEGRLYNLDKVTVS